MTTVILLTKEERTLITKLLDKSVLSIQVEAELVTMIQQSDELFMKLKKENIRASKSTLDLPLAGL